ncbi:unnamed protein product [Rhodiola kirilowii]
MTVIKEVSRSASVTLAPDAPYMAAGTIAGAVDLTFSSSANLELFSIDLQSDDRELPIVGACPSSERFNRLSWGKNGFGSEQFSLGLIAGGLVDGNIDLWNPLTLINSDSSESALVGHLRRHKGPVRGLEFNANAPNLLASGADEGEICIWDLAKPSEPSHFPPLKGSGSAAQGEISFLSWNSKVQHILASTSYNGTTVVWDLKKQKPVISFPDPNRRRCSVLQWNPDVATQLVVASDDDTSPSIRLWDMRNIMSPVTEFVGHTKGVIAMSWCPIDSSYLLTCAKDNRTICWDTTSAEIVSELPSGTNWNFDVHWYPKVPGVISVSSFDGKIGLYNIEGCSRYGIGDSEFLSGPLRAPKWYKRPAGVSFGFGGKLVSFHPKVTASGSSEIYVHSIVTEDSLIDRSSEFESAIHNGERASLWTFCEKKSLESQSEDDRETWGFLKVMFEDDGSARTKLLAHLGFSVPVEDKSDEQDDISQDVPAVRLEETAGDKNGEVDKGASFLALDNGEDFFNNLPSPKAETPVSTSENGHTFVSENVENDTDDKKEEVDADDETADPSFDDAIQRALVVGDYKAAVAQCIAANKMADALVIAHLGGASMWESTRHQYLKSNRSPYLKVVGAMVNNDLMNLINTRPLKLWKETLALLCSFAQREEWTLLCDTLASKLMAAGETLPATLCFICAGNIDKTVEIWSRTLASDQEGKSYIDLLQDLMEKTIVLALATRQKKFSASLCTLVERYAEILASQGLTKSAMEYLQLLGSDDLSPELLILRDRIALSAESEKEVTQTIDYESSQIQGGRVYESDTSNHAIEQPQNYYQEPATSHVHGVTEGVYGEVYQQPYPSTYGGGYGTPAPYQPSAPPNMFVPSQTVQSHQQHFASSPVVNQPPARPFIPSNPPALINAEKYQQSTPTLGSQLYPGNAPYQAGLPVRGSLPSQVGMIPGPRPHQVMATTPQPRGFTPVNNSEFQRHGSVSTQPSSPTVSTPVHQEVTPPAPPPTVQTADTSKVPVHHKPVISTLSRLFNETSEALGGSRANPAKRREIEDNSKKIGWLFANLNSGNISQNASLKLVELCQALDNGDFMKALQIQVQLTTSEWDECNFWLATLKRMIKTRQSVRLS